MAARINYSHFFLEIQNVFCNEMIKHFMPPFDWLW